MIPMLPFLPEALAIEQQQAQELGSSLGFMAALLVQAILPHEDPGPGVSSWVRSQGDLYLAIMAPSEIGLPWGKTPRLLLSWLLREAVRTQSPRIRLGANLSRFLEDIGALSAGERKDTLIHMRDQIRRLCSSSIHCSYHPPGGVSGVSVLVATRFSLRWKPADLGQPTLSGVVHLAADFFRGAVAQPVPVDLRRLSALRTPLALDLYSWLAFRSAYHKQPVEIPWSSLAFQFGGSVTEPQSLRSRLIQEADEIFRLYPAACFAEGENGLVLSTPVQLIH